MSLKISIYLLGFIFLLQSQTIRQQVSPYDGFSERVTVPAKSNFVVISDNVSDESINRYHRSFGELGRSRLQKTRIVLCSKQKLQQYTVSKNGSTYTIVETIENQKELIIKAPLMLGGYYLIILGGYSLSDKLDTLNTVFEGVINTTLTEEDSIIYWISETTSDTAVQKILQARKKVGKYTVTNVKNFGKYDAIDYKRVYEDYLSNEEIPYKHFVYVSDSLSNVYPAIIASYGSTASGYAMYGVWHDANKAQAYGYKKGDRIFFSEAEMTPEAESELTDIFDKKPRYGVKCWTYEEVLKDKEKIYPQLAWRKCPLWGDMEVKMDKEGNIQDILCDGEYLEVPINPDNSDNTNPLGFNDLPDIDWYYCMFSKKFNERMGVTNKGMPPTEFLSYETYISRKLSDGYDPTQYNADGSISSANVSTETQPKDVTIYDKDCNKLSGDNITIINPFGSGTKYELLYAGKYLGLGNDKYVDFTQTIRFNLTEIYVLFSSLQTNPKQIIKDSRFKIEIHKSEYIDSTWYLGNKMNKYDPFISANEFLTFHDYYIDKGTFLKIKTLKYDSDEEEDGYFPTKRFYLTFRWPMVYKDKNGMYHLVGYAMYDTKINSGKYIYGGNANGRNKYARITSTEEQVADFDKYDKNSKDYRTDQYDIKERAKGTPDDIDDKNMRELIAKIATAEVLDFTVKKLHQIGADSKNPHTKAAFMAMYETTKRIENNVAVKYTYKCARTSYEMYLIWRQSMDLCQNIRNTYLEMNRSWDGLKRTSRMIYSYYKNFQWNDIRLTTITKLLPSSNVYAMDYSIYRMHRSMVDFSYACHEMALHADSIVVCPVISIADKKLMEAVHNSIATSKVINQTIENLSKVYQETDQNPAKQHYVALLTRSVLLALSNRNTRNLLDGSMGIALALKLVTDEVNDWNKFGKYMDETFSEKGFDDVAAASKADRYSFYPIINHFRAPYDLFNNSIGDDIWKTSPDQWDFKNINKEVTVKK